MDYGMDAANIGANLGRQIMGTIGAKDDGYNRMAKLLADTSLKQAQGDFYQQKANSERQRAQYQTPEYGSKIAASLAGLSDPQAVEMDAYAKNGNWGVTPGYSLPAELSGPTTPDTQKAAPEWATPQVKDRYNAGRAAHMLNLGATGNSNADQVAKAVAELLGQGRIDQVISDPSKAAALGQAMAASKGSALYHAGPNGTMQLFTGQENLNDVGRSAAKENLAQANNANAAAGNQSASAALHRAQIPEVQSRIDLNKSKIGADQVVINPDGTQTIIKGSGKPGKAPTEFQAKSATYGARAKEAHDVMNELEALTGADAYNRLAATSLGGNGILNTLANPALSQTTQKAVQAQRDFINAVLRQESGAAIAPSEFANGVRQYFPQPGDKADVIEQKRRNRETAIMGFNNSAGNAAFEAPAIKQPSAAKQATPDRVSALSEAKAAIAAGAPRAAVIQRLKEMGIKDGAI